MTLLVGAMAGGTEEQWRAADRVHDREEAGIDEQEGVDDGIHGGTARLVANGQVGRIGALLDRFAIAVKRDPLRSRGFRAAGEAGGMTLTPAEAAALLRAAGIEEAEREVRLLLAHGRSGAGDSTAAGETEPGVGFAALVERRAKREPLALIVGKREFWSLSFAVSRATLIPRPESETLIEAALAAFPERRAVRRILDLGTGTGALLLALLSEFAGAFGVGIDRVAAAARLADANARVLGLRERARFLVGDWGEAVAGGFDLVVANPPYVERGAIGALMPEVALYEPASALDGGTDGLDAYRSIFPDLPRLLAPHGMAIVEIGAGAGAAVIELALRAGLELRGVRADLSGIPRALELAKAAEKNRLAWKDGAASLPAEERLPGAADSGAPGGPICTPSSVRGEPRPAAERGTEAKHEEGAFGRHQSG